MTESASGAEPLVVAKVRPDELLDSGADGVVVSVGEPGGLVVLEVQRGARTDAPGVLAGVVGDHRAAGRVVDLGALDRRARCAAPAEESCAVPVDRSDQLRVRDCRVGHAKPGD